MKKVVSAIIYVLRNEKKKIFLFCLFTFFFMIVLFPFSDVSDLVTAQISKATNNQVFVQFRDPGISLFPGIGFELNDVNIETNFLPPIKAKSITVSPSLIGLLTLKPGVKLNANQILGGDVDVSFQKTKISGKPGRSLNIDSDNIELSDLLNLASANLPLKGKVSLAAAAEIEDSFTEQPSAQLEAQINRFDLSSDTIATPLGPLNLPPLSLKQISLKGELREGKFLIEQLTAGQSSDELTAQVKGRMDVRVQPGPYFQSGPFDFEIRLIAKESFKNKAGLFLSFLNAYQKPGPDGTTVYAFRMKGNNFYMPPNLSPL